MDYTQFGKFMEKVAEIEKRMEQMENHLDTLSNTVAQSCEEVNGTLLRIESIVEAYVENSMKNSEE